MEEDIHEELEDDKSIREKVDIAKNMHGDGRRWLY